MIRSFLLASYFILGGLATYTYTITMNTPEQAVYVVTNVISALAWIVLGILLYFSRVKFAPRMVQTWVQPLAYAFKFFCALSAARYIVNILAVYYPIPALQSVVFILNNVSLAIAVGYASVFYRRVPGFLYRLVKHQEQSRRFGAISDVAVDAFLETDREGHIWYANRAAAEIFNARNAAGEPDRDLVLSRNIIDDFLAEPDRTRFSKMRHDYAAGALLPIIGRKIPTRVQMLRAGTESFAAEMTVTQYEVGDARRFCLIIRDISYRVQLENEAGLRVP